MSSLNANAAKQSKAASFGCRLNWNTFFLLVWFPVYVTCVGNMHIRFCVTHKQCRIYCNKYLGSELDFTLYSCFDYT